MNQMHVKKDRRWKIHKGRCYQRLQAQDAQLDWTFEYWEVWTASVANMIKTSIEQICSNIILIFKDWILERFIWADLIRDMFDNRASTRFQTNLNLDVG